MGRVIPWGVWRRRGLVQLALAGLALAAGAVVAALDPWQPPYAQVVMIPLLLVMLFSFARRRSRREQRDFLRTLPISDAGRRRSEAFADASALLLEAVAPAALFATTFLETPGYVILWLVVVIGVEVGGSRAVHRNDDFWVGILAVSLVGGFVAVMAADQLGAFGLMVLLGIVCILVWSALPRIAKDVRRTWVPRSWRDRWTRVDRPPQDPGPRYGPPPRHPIELVYGATGVWRFLWLLGAGFFIPLMPTPHASYSAGFLGMLLAAVLALGLRRDFGEFVLSRPVSRRRYHLFTILPGLVTLLVGGALFARSGPIEVRCALFALPFVWFFGCLAMGTLIGSSQGFGWRPALRILAVFAILALLTWPLPGCFSIWSWRIGDVSLTAPAALVLLVAAAWLAWRRLMHLEYGTP